MITEGYRTLRLSIFVLMVASAILCLSTGCIHETREGVRVAKACRELIVIGMSEDKVRELMGEPVKRREFQSDGAAKHSLTFASIPISSAAPVVRFDSASGSVEKIFCGE